jgi:UDP-N-acetylglucosamine transferase subunit ALG13
MEGPPALLSKGDLWRTAHVIFVTVGSDKGFPRLLYAVDHLKASRVIQDDVTMQIGRTPDFSSEVCKVVQFLSPAEYEQYMRDASVVICHGGAGTIIQALQAQKVPVVMPRRKHYGEHVDDHQLEGSQRLAAEGRIILVHEPAELLAGIEEACRRKLQPRAQAHLRMVELVSQAIEDLLARRA